MTRLMLKRARASRSSDTWKDEEPRRARRRRGGAAITGAEWSLSCRHPRRCL